MTDKKKQGKSGKNLAEAVRRVPDMLDLTENTDQKSVEKITLCEVVEKLSKTRRTELISRYNMGDFAKIFRDEGMMRTANAFISCGMNVCKTARKLYMHRNTLIYRLNAIRQKTGLDLRDFDMAVTFQILYILYSRKQ